MPSNDDMSEMRRAIAYAFAKEMQVISLPDMLKLTTQEEEEALAVVPYVVEAVRDLWPPAHVDMLAKVVAKLALELEQCPEAKV